MARSKSTFAVNAEYYPLRALLSFLQAVPFPLTRAFCRSLIKAILAIMPKRRQLIIRQLASCFPEKSAVEIESIARRSLDYLGDGVAMFGKIKTFDKRSMAAKVETQGFEHIDEALKKGKGVITFTAHYGCWELMAVYVTTIYPLVSMLIRPLDNARLNAMTTAVRGSGGGGVIDSGDVFTDGIKILRDNGILGILVDQNFYRGGVFVDFFGRPAATSTLVPILARRTGCTILPMHNIWVGDKVWIICEPPVTLSANPDRHQAIHEDTQTLTRYVEKWVREDPSQWLWLHNRWKRQPSI